MKLLITFSILTLSLPTLAGPNRMVELQELANSVSEAQSSSVLKMDDIPEACKTITSCTTDFKGNTSCTAKLVCDL